MWIKVGDYKRSEIGVVKGWMQSPVTSHQRDIYQTDEFGNCKKWKRFIIIVPDSCQTHARLVPDISVIEYGLKELRHFIKLMYAINNS